MANKIIINETTPSKLYIGNSEIKKAYIGDNLIFQKQKSLNSIFTLYHTPTITEDGIMRGYEGTTTGHGLQGIILTSEALARLKSGTIISLTYDYTSRHSSGREWFYGFDGYGFSSVTPSYPVCYGWDKAVYSRGNIQQVLANNRDIDNNVKITTTVKYSTNTIEIFSDSGEVAYTRDISANPMPFSSTSEINWGVGYITETMLYGNIYLAESYIQFPDEDKKYYMYE